MLRTLFAALLLVPLAFASADAMEKHRLALQISDSDPAKMNAVLNVAANVSKYYSDKGDEVEIQIVAFNAGLNMLRADKSPVLERLKVFKQGMPNVVVHGLREHARRHDPRRRQGAAAGRQRHARARRRRHADRTGRKGLDDRAAVALASSPRMRGPSAHRQFSDYWMPRLRGA